MASIGNGAAGAWEWLRRSPLGLSRPPFFRSLDNCSGYAGGDQALEINFQFRPLRGMGLLRRARFRPTIRVSLGHRPNLSRRAIDQPFLPPSRPGTSRKDHHLKKTVDRRLRQ